MLNNTLQYRAPAKLLFCPLFICPPTTVRPEFKSLIICNEFVSLAEDGGELI